MSATTMTATRERTDRPATPAADKYTKANSLYAAGYRITRIRGMEALISTPGGNLYLIDCASGTCNCQATCRDCKHLLGMVGLMQDQDADCAVRALSMREDVFPWAFTQRGTKLDNIARRMSDSAFEVMLALERKGILG